MVRQSKKKSIKMHEREKLIKKENAKKKLAIQLN